MRFMVGAVLAIGIIALLFAAGCADISVKKQVGDFGATFGTSSEEQKAIAPKGTGSWAGTWDTEWGVMQLTQSGNQVTGTYEYNDGHVSGTVSGNTFTGTWGESPSYLPPDDAGDFILTLSGNGTTFNGKWRYGSDGDWTEDDWYGQRPSPTGSNCWISGTLNKAQASWGDTIRIQGSVGGDCTSEITFKLMEGPGIPASGILLGTTTPTSNGSYQFDWNTGTTKQQDSLADGVYRIYLTSEPDKQYTRVSVEFS